MDLEGEHPGVKQSMLKALGNVAPRHLLDTRLNPPAELRRLVSVYQSATSRYSGDSTAAAAIATEPLGKLPDGMDATEAAAWTVVSNVLLNLDETVNRR